MSINDVSEARAAFLILEKTMAQRAWALSITHPHAAGIDIGSASHFVAVSPDSDDVPVREFRSFSPIYTRWPTGSRLVTSRQ
jgi:hypothetical protein